MEEIEFKLRGKVVQMARQIKNVKGNEFADIVGIHSVTLSVIENEERSISKLNEIRIIRALKEIGLSDAQLASLQIIVEHSEGKFDE